MSQTIHMSLNDTIELDYLINQINNNAIDVTSRPSENSYELDYARKEYGIFNPTETGTFQLNINGQIIEIEVTDIPDSVVENFEDGDIAEYSGDTGSFSVVQDRAFDGSNALYSNANYGRISSVSGLNSYPSAGDEIWWYTYIASGGDRVSQFFFGIQTVVGNSNYETRLNGKEGQLELRRNDASNSILDSASATIDRHVWIRNEIKWDIDGDGVIEYSAFNADTGDQIGSTLTAIDQTYTSGGISWGLFGGTDVDIWWDYAVKSA
jgi:hypothetical protein